jgi:pimeloyl-ACP methyl ester carboxylesterase
LQCAELSVPLDYDHPSGAHIDLAVIRRPAADPSHRIGALVVNPGGPGGSGVDFVREGFGTDNGFADRFDIVSWDPRGTGRSEALDCGSGVRSFRTLPPDPTSPQAQAELDASAQAIAADCGAHAGPLLDHVGTPTTARDLEQLRRALGEPKLTYAGFSYGTAIGLAYAQRYPTLVRAMVLDGVVEPNWDLQQLLGTQAVALEQSLQGMFDRCNASSSCPVRDAGDVYDRVAARLVRAREPAGSSSIGPSELATAAVESTYDPSYAAPFMSALAAADAGDGRPMLALAQSYYGAVSDYASYVSVVCVDLPHPVGAAAYQAFADDLATRAPRVGAAVANEVLPCAFWPAPVERVPAAVHAPDAPAILVVGNTGDAATPLSAAVTVAHQLDHSSLLTFEGLGHTSVDRSSCVDQAEIRYLEDLTAPPKGALCVAS